LQEDKLKQEKTMKLKACLLFIIEEAQAYHIFTLRLLHHD